MPAKGKQKIKKTARAVSKGNAPAADKKGKGAETLHIVKTAPSGAGGDLAAELKRLAREVDAIKDELSRRPAMGGNGGSSSRRDQDKVVADRLARLDEKVEAVWNRLADLEERVEGEGGAGHAHEAEDFEETPEKDFYDR
jgi:hypothetical protein